VLAVGCSGSEFSGPPPATSVLPNTNPPDAGSRDADAPEPSEGGAGGQVIEPSVGGNPLATPRAVRAAQAAIRRSSPAALPAPVASP